MAKLTWPIVRFARGRQSSYAELQRDIRLLYGVDVDVSTIAAVIRNETWKEDD